jgi:adenylosuccinate synthase
LGIAPNRIGEVFGIFKAYCTRVGSGPFPTELDNALGEQIRQQGHEFGSTTGRPRRTGWLDLVALKYAIEINGVTQLMMMKADVLNGMDAIDVCVGYEYMGQAINHLPYRIDDGLVKPIYTTLKGWGQMPETMATRSQLPAELDRYIRFIEEFTGVPLTLVSYGPDRVQTLHLPV